MQKMRRKRQAFWDEKDREERGEIGAVGDEEKRLNLDEAGKQTQF
jgi:hypothetical protein